MKIHGSHQKNIGLYKRDRQYPPSVQDRTERSLTVPIAINSNCSVYAEYYGVYPNGKGL